MTSATDNSISLSAAAAKRAMSPERVAKLKLDQLQMVVQNIRPGVFGLPFLALIICFVLAEWVPIANLGLWFAGVIAVTAFYGAGHYFFLTYGRSQLKHA